MWMAQCQPGFLDELWASEVTKQNKKVDRVRETVAEFVFWRPHMCAHAHTNMPRVRRSGECAHNKPLRTQLWEVTEFS